MRTPIILSEKDFAHFKNWLEISWDSSSYERKFEEELNEFWRIFYKDGLSVSEVMTRYEYAKIQAQVGPLYSWLNWLMQKHICHIFIYQDITMDELSYHTKIPLSDIAFILRNFFLERFPHQEDFFTEKFHIGNNFDKKNLICFSLLQQELGLAKNFNGAHEDEIMNGLEVTLYANWSKILKICEKKFLQKDEININNLLMKIRTKKKVKFIRDVVLLFVLGSIGLFILKETNQLYDDFLAQKIALFGQDYEKSNESLTGSEEAVSKSELDTELKEIKEFELKRIQAEEKDNEEREGTETEVVLSSLESVPSDFHAAEFDDPTIKEEKGGFRDEIVGQKKVYRVMIKSVQAKQVSNKVLSLIEKYEAESIGDTTKFERIVPGGIYFNLYIPQDNAVRFLNDVGQVKDSTILLSRNRKGAPPNKTKVFIWIKEI